MSLRPWEFDHRYVGVVNMVATYPEFDRASISCPFMPSVVWILLFCLLYASRVFHHFESLFAWRADALWRQKLKGGKQKTMNAWKG